MQTIHLETLTLETKKIWDKCDFLGDFYLAGGTALAMQLGHRISIDLDFFSNSKIQRNLLTKIEEHFDSSTIQVVVKTENELTLLIGGVKVTFLRYPFELLYGKVSCKPKDLASTVDIASMKAYALGRRQSLKDYVDLYYIILSGQINLEQIISDAQTKYGETFNDRLFLEQLAYTEDLDNEPIEYLESKIEIAEIKTFFESKIKEYIGYIYTKSSTGRKSLRT